MPQTQFKATGLTDDNTTQIKDAGMEVAGVQWVNVNNDNIVVTHEDSFDEDTFASALQAVDAGVNLTKA